MISLKQLEGFFWVAELGGVERAASRLHTTQSAISKRIQDLEAALKLELFDRNHRRLQTTPSGERLLVLAREMLAIRNRVIDLATVATPVERVLRIGITELTAMTWLPQLMERLKANFSAIVIEPIVDTSRNLSDQLMNDALDIVIVPDAFRDPQLSAVSLDVVEYGWMCAPSYLDANRTLQLTELGKYTIIDQVHSSGLGDLIHRWLNDRNVEFPNSLSCSSLNAVAALTISGLGISYLPTRIFEPLIAAGRLRILVSKPSLPKIPYVAVFKKATDGEFLENVASITAEACDFTKAVSLYI